MNVINQSIEKIIEYLDKNIQSPIICIINSIPKKYIIEYSLDIDKSQCNTKEAYNWYLEQLFKKIRNDCDNNKIIIEKLLSNVSNEILKYQLNF